jgi:hypothetical protein
MWTQWNGRTVALVQDGGIARELMSAFWPAR